WLVPSPVHRCSPLSDRIETAAVRVERSKWRRCAGAHARNGWGGVRRLPSVRVAARSRRRRAVLGRLLPGISAKRRIPGATPPLHAHLTPEIKIRDVVCCLPITFRQGVYNRRTNHTDQVVPPGQRHNDRQDQAEERLDQVVSEN